MKRFWVLISILLVSAQFIISQDISGDLNKSFSDGDAQLLSKHFNQNIELILSGHGKIYNKNQAAMIMKDFFKNNPPVSYQKIHKGDKDNSIFVIGKLTSTDKSYRISILIKKTNNVFLIHQIRIQNV